MPQKTFQCKQGRIESAHPTETPSRLPHSGGGSAYQGQGYEHQSQNHELTPLVGHGRGSEFGSSSTELQVSVIDFAAVTVRVSLPDTQESGSLELLFMSEGH